MSLHSILQNLHYKLISPLRMNPAVKKHQFYSSSLGNGCIVPTHHLSNLCLQLVLVQLDTVLGSTKKKSSCLRSKSWFMSEGVSFLLTSMSVMDTRLVSMVGCRGRRLPLSCRDIFLPYSWERWPLVDHGAPDLKPLGGVMRLAATFMAATMSASSPLFSGSGSVLQAVSALMVGGRFCCPHSWTSHRWCGGVVRANITALSGARTQRRWIQTFRCI